MLSLEYVKDIHDLHIWSLSHGKPGNHVYISYERAYIFHKTWKYKLLGGFEADDFETFLKEKKGFFF